MGRRQRPRGDAVDLPYIVFSNTNTGVDPWPFVVTEMATNLTLN